MGSAKDKVTGRIKQSVGGLTGDEKLKREGRYDERVGRTKQKADEAIDVVRDKLKVVTERLHPSEKEK